MDDQVVGERIKELRIKRKLRQRELAQMLSVANSTISNWETGRRLPSLAELKRLSEFFKVSLSYFDVKSKKDVSDEFTQTQQPYNQSIDLKAIEFTLARKDWIMFGISALLLYVSVLPKSLFSILFLILGFAVFAWAVLAYVSKRSDHRQTNSQKLIIPLSTDVHYVHQMNQGELAKYKKSIHLGTVAVLIMTMIVFMVAVIEFSQVNMAFFVVYLSFVGIAAITGNYYRYRKLISSGLFDHHLDYYSVHNQLRYQIFVISFLLDWLGFASLVALIALYNDVLAKNGLMIFAATLSWILIMLSYALLIGYKWLITGYRISVHDDHDKVDVMIE